MAKTTTFRRKEKLRKRAKESKQRVNFLDGKFSFKDLNMLQWFFGIGTAQLNMGGG